MWSASSKLVIFVFLHKSAYNMPKNTLMAINLLVVNIFLKIIILCKPNMECKSYQLLKMFSIRSASLLITSISSASLLAHGCFGQGGSLIRLSVQHKKCKSTCTFLDGDKTPTWRQKCPNKRCKCTICKEIDLSQFKSIFSQKFHPFCFPLVSNNKVISP